jgi:vacuolar-type H+-ATPase subunit D/Vma8
MSRREVVSPTRTNLLRSRRRLDRVQRGLDLLRKKREALAAELFRLARPAVDARTVIAQRAAEAYPRLHEAVTNHGRDRLRAHPSSGLQQRATPHPAARDRPLPKPPRISKC